MKLCRKCNVYYDGQELTFCFKCGSKLEDVNICLKCHTVNDLDATFCKKCGTKFNESIAMESVPDQTPPLSNINDDNTSEETTHTNWTMIIGVIIVIIGIFLAFNNTDFFSPNKYNDEGPQATTVIERKKAELSKNFQPITVVDATLFVPTRGLLIKDKAKYSPSTAFVGQVNLNNGPSKNNLHDNAYDIMVLFGRDKELISRNAEQEKKCLNKEYDNFWKGEGKYILQSKEFRTNIHGSKYLKFDFYDKLKYKAAIYIFEDTAYIIIIGAIDKIMNKCESEIELILDSFLDKDISTKTTLNTNTNINTNTNATKGTIEIPKDYQSIREGSWELYVPKEGFKRYELPKPSADGGIALSGIVTKKKDSNAPIFNMYNVALLSGKDPSLKSMKPEEEEEVLNNMFVSARESAKRTAKVATIYELISKEFCTNIFGHKYLKVTYISGNPSKPQNDFFGMEAFYIYGDMGYMVDVSTLKTSAERYKSEMEQILNYFNAN